MTTRVIDVQFSGKPAVYTYLVPEGDHPVVGQKVVVPTIIKTDGEVSLSIAKIVDVTSAWGAVPPQTKRYVQLLEVDQLALAEADTRRAAAAAVEAA